MPLPEDFSPWEHLREQITVSHNLNVERTFLGVETEDISNELGAMRTAVFIEADDTVDMIILRLSLYYFVFQGELKDAYYVMPVEEVQTLFKFKPQVHLVFREDLSTVLIENKLQRAKSEISFRLMTESALTMNEAKAKELALKIKELLLNFGWERGVNKYNYRDDEHGYRMSIFAESEAVAIEVIEKVLEIQKHAFSENHLTVSLPKKNYPVVPPLMEVYGKERRGRRERPMTRVRFRKAELSLYNLSKNVVLVSHRASDKPLQFI